MVDTLSIVLMAAALAGGVLRAYINGSLAQKQTIGDIIITGAAGGSFPMLGVIPKDLTLFHAGLMMFGVAYVASDALQRIYTGLVGRFAGPLIPPPPKTVILLPAMLLLAGCAAKTLATPEYQDPLQALNTVIAVDLDAADAIAVAHNDVIAHACFPVLKKYLGTATPSTDQIKGVISAFEKARVTRIAIEGQVAGGIPTDLKLGCSPLLMDERLFLIRLGLMAGGVLVK